jgi:hypothetical protein
MLKYQLLRNTGTKIALMQDTGQDHKDWKEIGTGIGIASLLLIPRAVPNGTESKRNNEKIFVTQI